jgi:16S rRNA (cytidine1402-2'-O)-methyltransferase
MIKRNKSFSNEKPLLYLLATPIGNLEEFSPRSINIISESDFIACEDTRNTKKLISFFGINKPLISLHEHNEKEVSLKVIDMIKDGKKICYVSDAGYPAISDPGSILVKLAIENDINVSVISGPNAALNALVASGLESDHFYFHGFLPSKNSDRENELQTLKNKKETIIFYESPHRIMDTLKSLYKELGDRQIVIARELTKIHEEYIRSTLKEIQEINPETLIGEMVLIVEGNKTKNELSDEEITKKASELRKTAPNLSNKDIAKILADQLNIPKNKIYNLLIKEKEN